MPAPASATSGSKATSAAASPPAHRSSSPATPPPRPSTPSTSPAAPWPSDPARPDPHRTRAGSSLRAANILLGLRPQGLRASGPRDESAGGAVGAGEGGVVAEAQVAAGGL